MPLSERFVALAKEAKTRIKETNVDTVKQKFDNNDDFLLIDVREADEWQRGHLPTALFASKGIIERDIEKIAPELDAEIILYCGGGSRSALAADNLQRMGYTNVWSMDGGFRGWVDAGNSVED